LPGRGGGRFDGRPDHAAGYGAAAFIMAEFTGIPYVKIIISAAIPAILYYLAVGTMVHLEACKLGLKGLPRSALPSIRELSVRFYLLLPVVFIIYFLVRGFTPLKAAYWGIVGTVIIGVIDLVIQYLQHHSDRIDIQEYARAMIQALAEGPRVRCPLPWPVQRPGLLWVW